MIPLRDHADRFRSDSITGVLGGEKLIPGPVRASGACIVGGDGKHGGAGLDHMEPDERLDFRIDACTRIHRILQQISDQNTKFRFRDHRRVIHLDRDLHGDPVFFCLFRVEGEDRVDGIIFTVGADLLRLEHLLIVTQIILQGSKIPAVGTIPDDSQVLPEIMPCPAVILNSGGEKIVLVRLDL